MYDKYSENKNLNTIKNIKSVNPLLDVLEDIYSPWTLLFYWRGEELFSLENIDKKKHLLHNINIDKNNS